VPEKDGDFFKSVYWADYLIEKFESNPEFETFVKQNYKMFVYNYETLFLCSKDSAKKYISLLYQEYFKDLNSHIRTPPKNIDHYVYCIKNLIERMASFKENKFNQILIDNAIYFASDISKKAIRMKNLELR
jgi:hypothetical protein